MPTPSITGAGWPTTSAWVKDTANGTRYLLLTTAAAVVTLTWANNSVNVSSFTGRITADLTVPNASPRTVVIRA